MRNWSRNLQEALSQHPEFDNLKAFAERLMRKRGSEISFAVVFGSAAKDTWTVSSDTGVFVGLSREDGSRFIDRTFRLSELARGNLGIFPYERTQWRLMLGTFNPISLDASEGGVVSFDNGEFALMRETFRQLRNCGLILRTKAGWRVLASSPVGTGESLSENFGRVESVTVGKINKKPQGQAKPARKLASANFAFHKKGDGLWTKQ
ncbi:MAG: nucleotidyltransferase domain-containing protein [Armatimonadetes bacterium]|nr:nucleotidyltransferase domain-containing protein [Armatimonadota bacterium]MCX7968071.1 nucleotidyltransferase domain-containing protein [Armatimonadota bacterium]MDW8143522.1 nucleotidyltransferase domain-containing protein [Armatimonadota bacterium]